MIYLLITVAVASLFLSLFAWHRSRPKPPTFKQIGDALERDIARAEALAKAEGRELRVDRTERMAPRRRIRF